MGGGKKQEAAKWASLQGASVENRVASQRTICRYRFMPAPLPADQLTIIRNLLAKGDTAGAIKVYIEATGATQPEAQTEVNHLATRYGLVGSQVPDLFVRRTPPKSTPAPSPEAPAAPPAPPPVAPPAPAPVAQQAANVPIEPAPPAPVPVRPPATPVPKAVPTPKATPVPARTPRAVASPASIAQPAASKSTPSAKKPSRWGCSSVILLVVGIAGAAWWLLA
jgi:hypothetical protein